MARALWVWFLRGCALILGGALGMLAMLIYLK